MKVCLVCDQRFESEDWSCPRCGHAPARYNGLIAFAPEMAFVNDGFAGQYFTDLVRLEAGSFWFRARNRSLIWALGHYFPRTSRFLEIGCGTGYVLGGIQQSFPGWVLAGSELFIQGLELAQRRLGSVSLFQMDARRIPFDGEFDVIGAFDVLEHVEEDQMALDEMFRATRPGGGIVLTAPQHRRLWSAIDEYSHHKRRYSRRELEDKVERAGFHILWTTSLFFLLLPLIALSRWRQPKRCKDVDPAGEYRLAPTLDSAFEKVMKVEQFLIERSISLPVGGSLLLIAKRVEV